MKLVIHITDVYELVTFDSQNKKTKLKFPTLAKMLEFIYENYNDQPPSTNQST